MGEESVTKVEKEVSLGNFGKWEEDPIRPPTLVNSANQSIISSCRICLSAILDPARLVCGHKFCESCLNKYWKANEEPSFLVCPLCRDYTCKIGFVQKGHYASSTLDFRKKFDPHHVDLPPPHSKTTVISPNYKYLRILPLFMPIVYFAVKFIKPVVLSLCQSIRI